MFAHVAFSFAPLQLSPTMVLGIMYGVRARTLRERGAPVPAWRQWCWYSGLALIAATLVSPLAHISDELFLAHMTEHLLIADLGALLLVVGLTGPLLQPILHVRELAWLRWLAHPVVALILWAVDFYVWHLPALYQGAVQNDAVHALEHLLFVGCGMAMWMALLGPLPKPAWFGNLARLIYIIIVRFTETVLANALLWSGTVFYPRYGPTERDWGISPINDQSAAGAIMMIEGSIVTICLFCWLFLRAARESEERQELVELAAARGVELDERRAARAVSAGRGEALRQRIKQSAPPPAPPAQ
ncbi:cytochrome c oxidase assembly protein [Candidatus Solirubrobacter pratensis]|uniref:cytochrome c oxidase assembly protein n=1 Tax=Candidatus Solirubrobacter pratensis TaxID=1298857 RepID=UPI00041A2C87|nr:cytochrome c oxidase assembly protein [Candidatus Solirubrobacter pratensis]